MKNTDHIKIFGENLLKVTPPPCLLKNIPINNDTKINIKINTWRGGLTSHIIQLIHVLQLGIYYNLNVSLPYHPYIITEYIKINSKITREDPIIIDEQDFLQKPIDTEPEAYSQNYKMTRLLIKKIFKMESSFKLNERDLVIYMNGGKVGLNNSAIIPPPLSYYTKIINNASFDRIILLSDQTNNDPVIESLLKLYPTIDNFSYDTNTKIQIIMGSNNVILNYDEDYTIIRLLGNDTKINIYSPSYIDINSFCINSLEINSKVSDLTEYKKKIYPWKNTEEQKKLCMHYELNEDLIGKLHKFSKNANNTDINNINDTVTNKTTNKTTNKISENMKFTIKKNIESNNVVLKTRQLHLDFENSENIIKHIKKDIVKNISKEDIKIINRNILTTNVLTL